jgi:hypothetical protein
LTIEELGEVGVDGLDLISGCKNDLELVDAVDEIVRFGCS